MRAVVLKDHLLYSTNEPKPVPQSEQALLKIRKAGICRTDLELIDGYLNFSGILGHEFVGEVVEGSDDLLGKRVVGEINVADGVCDMCQRGIPSQCRNRGAIGIRRYNGAFADYMALSRCNLHLVPDSVSDIHAVFTEPLAAGLQTLEAVHVSPRDRVVVIGAGKLGLLTAQVLRLTGANLAAVVRHESQAKLLNQWHIPAMGFEEFDRKQADVVVDCTGTAEGFANSLDLVKPRGTVILKSTYDGMPQIDMSRIAVEEIKVVGSRCGPFDAALRLLDAGLIDVESMIEASYPLDDALQAVDHASRRGALKVLLDVAN